MSYYQPGHGNYNGNYRRDQATNGEMQSVDLLTLSKRTLRQLQAVLNTATS